MTLTFVTNLVHHHQLPVSDEFFKLLGNDYHYISTESLPEWLIKGGYDPNLDRPYIIRTYLSQDAMSTARKLIDESDVVISGDAPVVWTKKRNKEGKITFYASERIYKEFVPWFKLPKAAIANYLNYSRYKNVYMLCASAFTSYDYKLTGCFINRCFKWGYFTAVENYTNKEHIPLNNKKIRFMWCARFLWWKHPELPVQLAKRLKLKGVNFVIDMFGNGEELEKIKLLIKELDVADVINLCGNRTNAEILEEMRQHDFFLFTSDRNEGWGAVLNEAMTTGCVPIVSNEIGSAPYLVKDGKNGLLFRSKNIDSLERVVTEVLTEPKLIKSLSDAAVDTMHTVWSPKVAASNFVDLARHALDGTIKKYERYEGPASWDSK